MKIDLEFIVFRLLILAFAMTLMLFFFYLLGTYQSFLDTTLKSLFDLFRLLAWVGTVFSLFFQILLFSWPDKRRVRRYVNLMLVVAFGLMYLTSEIVKSWVYPGGIN